MRNCGRRNDLRPHMPSLIVTSGVLAGQVFSFSDSAVIGRGQFSDVRLNDPTVSRRHARLVFTDNVLQIEDLGSTNGTSVDGAVVAPGARQALHAGIRLRLGDIELDFRYS